MSILNASDRERIKIQEWTETLWAMVASEDALHSFEARALYATLVHGYWMTDQITGFASACSLLGERVLSSIETGQGDSEANPALHIRAKQLVVELELYTRNELRRNW